MRPARRSSRELPGARPARRWYRESSGARPARWTALALGLLAAAACGDPEPLRFTRIVDLSYGFDADTLYWPTEEGFVRLPGTEGFDDSGAWYAAHGFRAAEHGGTHVDAPIHFAQGARRVGELPLERLVAPAVLIDASAAAGRDPDHAVGLPEIDAWEARHGPIPAGSIVLLRTGFGLRWPDRAAYLGTAERGSGAVAALHFPGLGAEGARRLVERGVAAVGIDTASIDPGVSRRFETHRVLADADVPVFENLARLEELPERGFAVVALPMKIRGGTGAPLRAIALLP